MKRFLILILLNFILLTTADAKGVVYTRYDSVKVVNLLEEASQLPESTNWNLYFARRLRGVKYENYILEQTPKEQLIVDLRHLDCTTFVETVLSLTLCRKNHKYTFDSYCYYLQQLRYRDGKITDFSSRLHYFTDWIRDNVKKGYVTWVQSPNPPFTAVKTPEYNCMTKFRKNYRQLVADTLLIPKIEKCEKSLQGMSFRYIPKSALNGDKHQLSCIKDGDVISMVTSAMSIDVAHLGIAVWGKDGKLHMIDASKIQGKVYEEAKSMFEYQATKRMHTGIIVVKLNE